MIFLVVKEWQSREGVAEIIDMFDETGPADNLALHLQLESTHEVMDKRTLQAMPPNRMTEALLNHQRPSYKPGDMRVLWELNEQFQGDITFRVAEVSGDEADFKGVSPIKLTIEPREPQRKMYDVIQITTLKDNGVPECYVISDGYYVKESAHLRAFTLQFEIARNFTREHSFERIRSTDERKEKLLDALVSGTIPDYEPGDYDRIHAIYVDLIKDYVGEFTYLVVIERN